MHLSHAGDHKSETLARRENEVAGGRRSKTGGARGKQTAMASSCSRYACMQLCLPHRQQGAPQKGDKGGILSRTVALGLRLSTWLGLLGGGVGNDSQRTKRVAGLEARSKQSGVCKAPFAINKVAKMIVSCCRCYFLRNSLALCVLSGSLYSFIVLAMVMRFASLLKPTCRNRPGA